MTVLAAAIAATNLITVVVEASRLDNPAIDLPSSVRVIGSDEIAASGVRDVVELLERKSPEVHLRRLGCGNPALAEISLRGYGENGHGRTLVLVDGERLNSSDLQTPNLSRIALNGVSKIEILKGPQTVLHGDGASAGVLNVVTEPPSDECKSYVEARGGSWGTFGAALGTRGGLAGEGIRYWADGSYDRSDGAREHAGYSLWNLNGGVRKTWQRGTYLRASGFYSEAQYDLPGALSYWEWKTDPCQSHAAQDYIHRLTSGLNTTFGARLDDENALKVTGNFSNRKLHGYQQGTGWFSDNEYDLYSYRILAEWINETRLFGFENECVAGAEYAADLLDGMQKSGFSHQRPAYDRQGMDYYAQDVFHLTEDWAVQLGGRYARSWAHNNLCESDRRTDNLGAFEAALLFNPSEDSKLYARATRFYRKPFLDEVPGRFDAGYNWVNTEILAPETGWTAEIGAEGEFAEEFSAGADAYGTWLEDEIFYDSLSRNNVNSEDLTVRRGVDAHVAWEREKVAGLSLAASFVRATFEGGAFEDNRIPLVPETTLAANGRVWLCGDCHVFGGYRFQGETYTASDFGNDLDKLDWFGVFHLGLSYEPTFLPRLRGVKATLSVENLLDENYCDYATYGSQYYPAAGRTFTFTLRYAF